MKISLGISNFLEEISSLSQSIVFLYFFSLITEEGFLISPCYSKLYQMYKWSKLLSSGLWLSHKEVCKYFYMSGHIYVFHYQGLENLVSKKLKMECVTFQGGYMHSMECSHARAGNSTSLFFNKENISTLNKIDAKKASVIFQPYPLIQCFIMGYGF